MSSRIRLPVVLALALAGCHDSSDSGGPPAEPLVANEGLAAERIIGKSQLRFVVASEEAEGRDLDGDGDALDPVLELLDLEHGTRVNTGLAVPPRLLRDEVPPPEIACSDALGVFLVDEEATGSDADGDGNPQEFSTWTFDRRTGRLAAVPFGYLSVMLGGDLAALVGSEGDRFGLRVLDGRDGSATLLPVEPYGLFLVQDDLVAFAQNEEGEVDLNLDGDMLDTAVLQLYDAGSRRLVNTALAVASTVRKLGDHVVFQMYEGSQGEVDLDGDGDAHDYLLVSLNARTGQLKVPGIGTALFSEFPRAPEDPLLLVASEGQHGDRNGDGDASDLVAVVYDPRTERVLETGLATHISPLGDGRWVGVQVSEADQGQADLDGDGRSDSDVLCVVDGLTGAIQDLGFAGAWRAAMDGHLLATREERAQDWNGDGDQGDFVLFDWSARTRTARSTGLAGGFLAGSAGETVLVLVAEDAQSADLNGDGDLLDIVYELYDGRTGRVKNLGLATTTNEAYLGADGRGALLVSEPAQGADLNGDGDELDDVLFTLDLDPLR